MNAKESRIGFKFGALSPKLSVQLSEMGYSIKSIKTFQDDADAITRLVVRGFIPDGAARKARQKIVNLITRIIEAEVKP